MKNSKIVEMIILMIIVLMALTGCAEKVIYDGAKESVQSATDKMSNTATEMFNQKYEAYKGEQRGSSVKALVSTVITENKANASVDEEKMVKIEYDDISSDKEGDLIGIRNNIESGKTYTITLDYTNGLVSKIVIK